MAIEWGKQTWSEVLQDMIVNCYKKTWLSPQQVEEHDNPFKGKDELPALEELMDKVGSSCDAEVFIFTEDSIAVSLTSIEKTNPNWRNDLWGQIVDDEDGMLSAPDEKQDRTIDRVRTIFRPKIQGLFKDFPRPYLEISRTFCKENFTSKPN